MEVRVLFGALREAPLCGAFRVLGLLAGTLQDYATQGRKRLLPWCGESRLAAIDEDRVRGWLADMAELVDAGELSAKAVNNARTCLSMTLGEAVRRGNLAHNPCRYVPERSELDYLQLGEIERYLEACVDHYRPLAEFLIGTGARISEALATRRPRCGPRCRRPPGLAPAARGADATVQTKGKRFRSMQIGPRPVRTLRTLRDARFARGQARPPTTGTSERSKTPACATGRSTRCAIQRRRRGWRPTTR